MHALTSNFYNVRVVAYAYWLSELQSSSTFCEAALLVLSLLHLPLSNFKVKQVPSKFKQFHPKHV